MHFPSWLPLLAALSLSIGAVSCDGPSAVEDGVPREVSVDGGLAAAFSMADGRTPIELLAASDRAMQQVTGITVSRTIGEGESTERDVLSLSPAAGWTEGDPGRLSGILAPYADRVRGGLWLREAVDENAERGITAAEGVRFVGETEVGDQEAWVIWYSFTQFSIELPFPVWRTEWIAKDDLRLLRQVQDDADGLGQRVRIDSVIAYQDR